MKNGVCKKDSTLVIDEEILFLEQSSKAFSKTRRNFFLKIAKEREKYQALLFDKKMEKAQSIKKELLKEHKSIAVSLNKDFLLLEKVIKTAKNSPYEKDDDYFYVSLYHDDEKCKKRLDNLNSEYRFFKWELSFLKSFISDLCAVRKDYIKNGDKLILDNGDIVLSSGRLLGDIIQNKVTFVFGLYAIAAVALRDKKRGYKTIVNFSLSAASDVLTEFLTVMKQIENKIENHRGESHSILNKAVNKVVQIPRRERSNDPQVMKFLKDSKTRVRSAEKLKRYFISKLKPLYSLNKRVDSLIKKFQEPHVTIKK